METSLHQRLKHIYATDEDQIEAQLGRFRIDVRRQDELVEIQHASLSSIRDKIKTLVRQHQVRVVKPIVAEKQLVRCAGKGDRVLSRRKSPKKGKLIDVFDELIYFRKLFPHPNLVVEVPLINVEEWSYPSRSRVRRRRRPKKYAVEDQRLVAIQSSHEFRESKDLTALLPDLPEPFDTAELASGLGIPRWSAQKITYCLRHMGAISPVGKRGNAILYVQPRGETQSEIA